MGRRSLERRLHKLFGRYALIFMEGLDEVTFIVKAAGDGSLFDGNIPGGQHFAGTLNAIVVQVINGRALRHAAEIPAEISGIHAGDAGKGVQTDGVGIIFCDVAEYIL